MGAFGHGMGPGMAGGQGMRSMNDIPFSGEVIDVPADGSCGFSALHIVLHESPDVPYFGTNPQDLRRMLASALPKYWEQFFHIPALAPFRASHNIRDLEMVQQMIAQPTTWLGDTLDQFELIVIASELMVRIVIIAPFISGASHPPDALLVSPTWGPGERPGRIIAVILPIPAMMDEMLQATLSTVYLYLDGKHYLAVLPRQM